MYVLASKSGGGTQGREVKMKSTKKKYMKGAQHNTKDEDSDDNDVVSTTTNSKERLEFMTPTEIEHVLQGVIKDCPEEFITEIAQQLYRSVRYVLLLCYKRGYKGAHLI